MLYCGTVNISNTIRLYDFIEIIIQKILTHLIVSNEI